MRTSFLFGSACSLLLIFVVGGSECLSQVTAVTAPEGKDKTADLRKFDAWAKGFADKPHTDILLPDVESWFAQHFESELAKKLAAEYRQGTRDVAGLPMFFQHAKSQGKTEVRVSHFSKAIDMRANGLQNAALQRSKKKLTLYTLRMVAPGEESGSSLWSFIQLEGKYRFVGKMTVLNPTSGDLATDVLCQLPLGDAEKLLQEKQVINKSAVDYLKEKGVLK